MEQRNYCWGASATRQFQATKNINPYIPKCYFTKLKAFEETMLTGRSNRKAVNDARCTVSVILQRPDPISLNNLNYSRDPVKCTLLIKKKQENAISEKWVSLAGATIVPRAAHTALQTGGEVPKRHGGHRTDVMFVRASSIWD